MKKTLFLILACLCLFSQYALSVPAVPWPVEKQQPDGTIITVKLKGDEKVHWMESLDGYTLLYNDSKQVVYAQLDEDGDLVPSDIVYGNKAQLSPEQLNRLSQMKKYLRYSNEQVNLFEQIWKIEDEAKSAQKASVKGDKKALCILAAFKDKSFTKTVEQFENLMNQVGYNEGTAKGSVKDFYRENSYGEMDLTVTVVGPYTLTNNLYYYSQSDSRYLVFAKEAIQAADADVDFKEFANSNNVLETVHILFAGYGDEAIGNRMQIWSHKWEITPMTLDGVRISTYSCSPELRGYYGSTITGIGVICHELCHVFGSDDYYDTDYQSSGGNYPNTGEWDLMAGGSWGDEGDSPAHLNMFQKILYEWVTPIELTYPKTIKDMPNSAENPVAYIVKPFANNEQYVLENRQQIGFDRSVPGNGLLIYHIHNSASEGKINNTSHPQQAYVVSASSMTKMPYSSPSSYGEVDTPNAPFASSAERNAFTKETTPAMFRWNGSTATLSGVLDKPITNISQSEGLVCFDFMGGAEDEVCEPIQNLDIKVLDEDAVLTWDAPINADKVNYKYSVYMSKIKVAEKISDRTFSFGLNDEGTYVFSVVASGYECTSEMITDSIVYSKDPNVVRNLSVRQYGKDVTIEWTQPKAVSEDHVVKNYIIYRDNELLVSLPNTQTSYIDEEPEVGAHIYEVIAEYLEEELPNSVKVEIDVLPYDACVSVEALTANMIENELILSWNSLPNVDGYKIYRNDEIVEALWTENVYRDTMFVSGEYIYKVVTLAEERESNPVEAKVQFLSACDRFEVYNVKLSLVKNDARLSWNITTVDPLDETPIVAPKFNVYMNGALVVEETEEMAAEIPLTEDGIYQFSISYVSDYCVTEPKNAPELDFEYTGLNFVDDEDIDVYPTITNGPVSLNFSGNASINVRDLSGRLLDVYQKSNEALNIELNYTSGMYILMIETNQKTCTKKIILRR